MSTQVIHDSLLETAKARVKQIFDLEIPVSEYSYHSFDHTMQVFDAAQEIAELASLTFEEREILGLAALFHDVGFSKTYKGHEDDSIAIAKAFLESYDYPQDRIQQVLDCIGVTKVKVEPKTRLQRILKDADMCSLGKKSYFEQAESLRVELNTVQQQNISPEDWHETNIRFLENHDFCTREGRLLFGERKRKNLDKLKSKPSPDDPKTKKLITLGTSRSAQTQFKTSLRNHIDLSAIADNKANIMLSVNALIITIALPILGTSIKENPSLLIPTMVLLTVCVISIVFATLATRPIKMKGKTTLENILSKKSNLFFFGNYHAMTFEQYEEGIAAVLSDEEILDNSIIRDLFYLGKALGKKYRYLRLCYNFFMFGIISVVIAFTIAFIFS